MTHIPLGAVGGSSWDSDIGGGAGGGTRARHAAFAHPPAYGTLQTRVTTCLACHLLPGALLDERHEERNRVFQIGFVDRLER